MKVCVKIGEFSTVWCEVRTVIKFLNAEGVTGLEIHRRLSKQCAGCRGNVMSLRRIYKWIECFNTGPSNTHDEQQTGHPGNRINDETIACVSTLLTEDHQFTISYIQRDMAEHYVMHTGHTTIFRILTEELEVRKSECLMDAMHADTGQLPKS